MYINRQKSLYVRKADLSLFIFLYSYLWQQCLFRPFIFLVVLVCEPLWHTLISFNQGLGFRKVFFLSKLMSHHGIKATACQLLVMTFSFAKWPPHVQCNVDISNDLSSAGVNMSRVEPLKLDSSQKMYNSAHDSTQTELHISSLSLIQSIYLTSNHHKNQKVKMLIDLQKLITKFM